MIHTLAALLLVLLLAWAPAPGWADASCDGVDDALATGLAMSTFITNTTGTIMAVLKHTGALSAGGNCGREEITTDANGLVGLFIDDTSEWAAGNWIGSAECARAAYSADTWVHLTWRHAGGVLDLFVNGVLAATTSSGTTTSLVNVVFVCGNGNLAGDPVNMIAAEVLYYATALTDQQILAVGKSRLKGFYVGSPTAAWDFGQVAHGAAATTVAFVDRSGNGRSITADDGANNTGMTGQGSTFMSYQAGGIQ